MWWQIDASAVPMGVALSLIPLWNVQRHKLPGFVRSIIFICIILIASFALAVIAVDNGLMPNIVFTAVLLLYDAVSYRYLEIETLAMMLFLLALAVR